MTDTDYIKIKTADFPNLQDLALEYQISWNELRDFHNQHCSLHELLPLQLPKHVEFVYLPSEIVEKRQVNIVPSTRLEYPNVTSSKTYGIVIKSVQSDLQIHYKISVKRLPGNIVEINKHKTFVNNREIDQTIEQLVETASQTLYPLHLLINTDGSVNKIINTDEIKERWAKNIKPQLTQYYNSDVADEIISKMDHTFKNINSKKDFLKRNVFFHLFFLPIYQSYSGHQKKQNFEFFFAKRDSLVKYDSTFNLEQKFTRSGKIALRITGKEADSFFSKSKNKGELNLLYKLHQKSHDIFSITGFISSFDGEKAYKTEVQMFELNE